MTSCVPHLVTVGAVVSSSGVCEPGWVEVSAGLITGLGEGTPERSPDTILSEYTVVPGFVDMHVHGGGGASFTAGDVEEAARAVTHHRRYGTTTMLASLISATPEDLERQVCALTDLVEEGLLAGIHLEGPWLAQSRRGAHDAYALRDPDPAEISRLLKAGRGHIRMVTLAPERPGGLAAIRQLTEASVTVAIGHSEADYAQTQLGIDAGAKVATHLFNAMPTLHHRRPGPVLALLEDPRVVVELIADGIHVHPALLRHVINTAGSTRVALITDAIASAGTADGQSKLGSLHVVTIDGIARLRDGTLAGGTGNTNLLYRAALTAVDHDLHAASELTATTPAATLGLTSVGTLEVGKQADLVFIDNENRPSAVMTKGTWVWGKPTAHD